MALTTDFGVGSPYVAQMKGVLLSAIADVSIVDVTHDLPTFDIRAAELLLRSTAFAFPVGTVHLVVVDPGVGGARRPIAVALRGCFFVGPDNGVLGSFCTNPESQVVVLDREALHRRPVAPTFHGRDIFAPVAAELAGGLTVGDVGSVITDATGSTLPRPTERDGALLGVTLGADRYGNLTTNVPAAAMHGGAASVTVDGKPVKLVRTYVDAQPGELVALAGSDGYLEIAMREAPAAKQLGEHGTVIVCRRP